MGLIVCLINDVEKRAQTLYRYLSSCRRSNQRTENEFAPSLRKVRSFSTGKAAEEDLEEKPVLRVECPQGDGVDEAGGDRPCTEVCFGF